MKNKSIVSTFLSTILIAGLLLQYSCSSLRGTKETKKEIRDKIVLTQKEINILLENYRKYLEFDTIAKTKNIKVTSDKNNKVTIAWEDFKSPMQKKTTGYKLYFGSAPGRYDGKCVKGLESPINIPISLLDKPEKPVVTVTGIEKSICYFAIASYNKWGESALSAPIKRIVK